MEKNESDLTRFNKEWDTMAKLPPLKMAKIIALFDHKVLLATHEGLGDRDVLVLSLTALREAIKEVTNDGRHN